MDIIPPLLLQVMLIALNAIFASAEIAIISMSEAKCNKLVADGNKRAKGLLNLITNPAKLLATIQIAITLSGFLGSAFAANNFSVYIMNALSSHGIVNESNAVFWDNMCVIVITCVLSYFTLVFGELVPKRLAMKKSEGVALTLAGPLNIISKIFTPIVWLLTVSTNGLLKLMGIDPNETENVSEEDIQLMVDTSEEIHEEEKQMIQNVFEFNDIQVNEFATHRIDVEILWEDDDVEKWDEIIKTSFHKNYPICKDTVDNIIGVLNIKEYFKLENRSKETILEMCVHAPYFVPETIKADLLFRQMKQSNHCFAIVLDEHGGLDGVVTFDDIIEQIVGNFNSDEPAGKEPNIVQIEENAWRVLGATPIEEINQEFQTSFLEEDYETFGGLVFGTHGQVPADDSVFNIDIDNLHIEIKQIKEHKIEEAVVSLIETTEEAEE